MSFVRKIHSHLLILCIITTISICIAEQSYAQQCKQYLFYVEASGRTVAYADAIADAMYRFMHTGNADTVGCTIKYIKNDGYQDGIRGKAKQIRSNIWNSGCRSLDSISREDIAKVLRTMEGNRGEVEGVHTYIGLMNKLKEEVDVAYDKIAVFYSFVCANNSENFTKELSASTREFHEATSIIEQSGKVTFFELPIKELGSTEKLIRDDVFKKLPKMHALNEKLDARESIVVRKPTRGKESSTHTSRPPETPKHLSSLKAPKPKTTNERGKTKTSTKADPTLPSQDKKPTPKHHAISEALHTQKKTPSKHPNPKTPKSKPQTNDATSTRNDHFERIKLEVIDSAKKTKYKIFKFSAEYLDGKIYFKGSINKRKRNNSFYKITNTNHNSKYTYEQTIIHDVSNTRLSDIEIKWHCIEYFMGRKHCDRHITIKAIKIGKVIK